MLARSIAMSSQIYFSRSSISNRISDQSFFFFSLPLLEQTSIDLSESVN